MNYIHISPEVLHPSISYIHIQTAREFKHSESQNTSITIIADTNLNHMYQRNMKLVTESFLKHVHMQDNLWLS